MFAVVGPAGTDFGLVTSIVREELSAIGYESHEIRLSELFRTLDKYSHLAPTYEEDRYEQYMDAGNNLRATLRRCDALALLAVNEIRKIRKKLTRDNEGEPKRALRRAYIIRRLVRPEEVTTLRIIYGRGFFLIAAYSSRAQRSDVLSKKIAESHFDADREKYRARAEHIIQRDARETVPEAEKAEEQRKFGQNVTEAFPMADIFIKVGSRDEIKSAISRFIKLIYSYPYHTPTRHEFAMFHAQAAALRSADLSRQVGAVIATDEGDIVAVGCNDVPKASGGLYWEGDAHDSRDFKLGYDSGTKTRIDILSDVIHRLRENNWLSADKRRKDVETLVKHDLLSDTNPLMEESQLMDLLEFGRSVHAEMAALMDASRRGVAVKNCTLYSTTFPCHMCARHIIAAGIKQVVYIEPYPKSRAEELYPESVAVDKAAERVEMVKFNAFAGIAPRCYLTLFTMPKRKDDEGNLIDWQATDERARVGRFVASYLQIETKAIELVLEELSRHGIGFSKIRKGKKRRQL